MTPKEFLIYFFICSMALIALDRGVGFLLATGYHRIRHGEQRRTNWVMDSCRAKTIILGSSRAAHHYVPEIIGRQLSSDCYNAGKDKQRLPYCLAVLKALYARYTPETIILDLNPTAFQADENGLNELSILLPYYRTNPELRPIIDQRDRFERIKTLSILYCYNSLAFKILFNSFSENGDDGTSYGYVPLKVRKEIVPATPRVLSDSFPVDPKLEDCFNEIIALTRRYKSKLVVVVSPVYYTLPPGLTTIAIAKRMTELNHIAFFDFSDEFTSGPGGDAAFLDLFHLNDSSARIFSGRLAAAISHLRRQPG